MDTRDLKKYLAGFGIAGLIAGAGLAVGAGASNAAGSCSGGKGGTGVTTEQTITKSS
ncbi:MAG TPA: SbtA family thio(seleno)oxazole RiPP natural product precursor [Nitrospirota bacterium]|nr:SbtA family thio(seleno)oxazole RiPP natural product precursor [Nitrospirota bacterium]